jgi:large conductance mechanosensitive channel
LFESRKCLHLQRFNRPESYSNYIMQDRPKLVRGVLSPVRVQARSGLDRSSSRAYIGGEFRVPEAPMLKGFKQFILRGNVVDMAVGVVIGAAFAGVVGAFTKDLLTPLIAAIIGKPDFSAIKFTVNGSMFAVGDFINAAVSFLLVAAAVYFFVVTPINALVSRTRKAPAPADPTTKKCPECLSEIPIDARRCAHCGQPVAMQVAAD